MVHMEIDKEYIVLQSKYRSLFDGRKNVFPNEWYNIREYELKKKILKECIKHNILIKNSSLYYEFRVKALGE